MLGQKIYYKKRLEKTTHQDRDFGATFMTVDQLRLGIARAKNGFKTLR